MSSKQTSRTPVDLDAALRLVYSNRPAKLAQLTGLVDVSTELPKLAANYGNLPATPPKMDAANNIMPNKMMQGDYNKQLGHKQEGPQQLTGAPKPISLAKTAMTEEELMAYYGASPQMQSSGEPMDPKTMVGLGAGGAAAVGANRMRTKNIAKRELANIRRNYMDLIESGTKDKNLLKNLNKELKLRGALGNLKMVPTAGMADALLAKSEGALAKRLLKQRYRGVAPLLAAGLLGTLGYNKLSE